MTRSYKGVYVKKHRIYSVADLMRRYSVSANTVSNWVGEGLTPSDGHKPYLFQGASIRYFHGQRRERLRTNLRAGEFKCTGCKAAVFPAIDTVHDFQSKSKSHMYVAVCPDCDAQLWKLPSATDRDIIEDCRNPNTSRTHLHEGSEKDPGRIWTSEDKISKRLWLTNDRVIYKWLTYAEKYDVKTVDRHLAAIRYCENLTDGKNFSQFTIEHVSKVRKDLKRRARADADDPLSPSTIRHIISHLSAFFDWLLKQDGFRRLPKDISGYFKLPKAVLSSALPVKVKEYPTIKEAEMMLKNMPSRSFIERRAQAIFALAFLGALRADTLISLQIRHFDISRRRIVQDASEVRAKNGKSEYIVWFPIPDYFQAVVIEWVQSLLAKGFCEDDALFPSFACLKSHNKFGNDDRAPFPPMSTKHAVTKAFLVASRNSPTNFTPHAAKHTIAAERDAQHLTHKQRKAWSENLGHENERITQLYYGKFSDDQRAEVIEGIKENGADNHLIILDTEKLAIMDEVIARLNNS